MRVLVFEKDFKEVPIRGKGTRGNLVTRAEVQRIALKQKGGSTLGGRKVWFDRDVLRLNYNEQGDYIGEFEANDRLLVIQKDGTIYTTDFSESNHFATDVVRVEKYDAQKIWSVVYKDKQQGFFYLKRFSLEDSTKPVLMQGEENELVLFSDTYYARFGVIFDGHDADRPEEIIEAADFIGLKSIRARGKRLTTRKVAFVEEREPLRYPTPTVAVEPIYEGESEENREDTDLQKVETSETLFEDDFRA